jgi:patatin-like phospholipase/acyl hydrolase
MRGLLTILLLEALEQELDRLRPGTKVRDVFHIFAGTSTGSLIACGLAQGLTLEKLRDLFEREGTKIFETFGLRFYLRTLLRSLFHFRLSLPLFSPSGLESVLRADDVFPDHLLFGNLPKPVIVISYDGFNRKGVVFKNSGTSSEKSFQLPVWQVCRSSSAAPVAFPAFLLNNTVFLRNHRSSRRLEGDLDRSQTPEMIPMIDGGMLANNPALCAIAEVLQQYKDTKLDQQLLVSFGTGQTNDRITPKQATLWGVLDWSSVIKGIPIYQVCADGSADLFDFICKALLNENYVRFQPIIDKDAGVFQADRRNLYRIKQAADHYLNSGGRDKLQDLAKRLIQDFAETA